MANRNVHEFGQDNWQTEVVESNVPVLVDFWAPWCGPCRLLSPVIDKIADSYAGKVKVGKLNIDENPELAAQYRASSIPRVLLFKGSPQPLDTIVGLTTEKELEKKINTVLGV
jgi:thioredoxin 1